MCARVAHYLHQKCVLGLSEGTRLHSCLRTWLHNDEPASKPRICSRLFCVSSERVVRTYSFEIVYCVIASSTPLPKVSENPRKRLEYQNVAISSNEMKPPCNPGGFFVSFEDSQAFTVYNTKLYTIVYLGEGVLV
uniref:RNA-directed DNA polymerase n=1 Tax=Strongyloides venezuelensis TaxID=75913 RepID=A0A0K0F527_STRVS